MSAQAEARSRQVAEAARETEWKKRSFLRELFLGKLHLEWVHPFADSTTPRPEFRSFYAALEDFLVARVDPVAIDATGEYPPQVLEGLAQLGAFGMKIPIEYGGLGLTQREYGAVMQLVGSHDANLTALLSAHQSIGVPQPLKLFGTEEQKRKYLPRCARGAISAFALTEPAVGSDPARIACTAERTADGEAFVLNGVKLWCTNGTLAELLVVIARTVPGDQLSAFVVETAWPGVEVLRRCRFMGLRALANAEIAFHDVRVPRENLIGEEGRGLKIALVTLNTGRLTLPAATAGNVKACLEICRKWCNVRVQWGQPIGKHEAIAHKLADMAAAGFAMDSIAELAAAMADRKDYDVRLEAAAAKEWNTVRAWQIVDDALEIRGGRGFETERSLAARAEVPIGIERLMRDSRVNRIFEGTSEIMHLFMAREAVDKHLAVAGALIDPAVPPREKLRAFLRAARFYLVWYPSLWIGYRSWLRLRAFGALARHLRFVERASRKLARGIFHAMLVHRGALERRQALLFRIVDVAMDLFAMTAAVVHAQALHESHSTSAPEAASLADLFCRTSRRAIRERFRAFWRNDDALRYRVGRAVLDGRHAWLEGGIVGLRRDAESLEPAVPEGATEGEVASRAPSAGAGETHAHGGP
jgi:alkylation response protein AidB-like acyl-CoA dehydrogenase